MKTLSIWLLLVASSAPVLAEGPAFQREIRPLLAGRCFKCHGPDAETREGGLRLDTQAGASSRLESGKVGVVPGDPKQSEVLARITSTNPDLRMPPPAEGPPLMASEIDLLSRWIAAGAKYESHWSYEPPRKATLPGVSRPEWCGNPIDRFVLSRLDREGRSPQKKADPAILLRRVTLDLTGLPPTIEEADAFLANPSSDAYAAVVDRLLASPAFGERFGRPWLDLARYADSAGYADDPPRVIWRYRDWVISALNSGMGFDQFSIEQLAGDLLPSPTESQLIATGFHRNTMTNSEGGTDDEEFRNVAIVDRVNTTMQTWMATTVMCAQCHSHKYDPISQKEFFELFAILNQTEDADRRDESPLLSVYTPEQEQQRAELRQKLAVAQERVEQLKKETPEAALVEGPVLGRFVRVELPGKGKILSLAEVQVFQGDRNLATKQSATQSSTAYDAAASRAVDGETNGQFEEAKSTTHTATEESPWWELDLGTMQAVDRIVIWNRTDSTEIGKRLNGARIILLDESRKPRWAHAIPKAALKDGTYKVPSASSEFSVADRSTLTDVLAESNPRLVAASNAVKSLQKQLDSVSPITTPIMREIAAEKHRKTRIQRRGNFLDLGDEVQPGTPAVFPPVSSEKPNRLDLARWLVSPENPLTSRVVANRLWEHFFGIGLVETSEEFGQQGEMPSHPELLDWLAVETIERQWDLKQMVRLIVLSETYQQASAAPEELVAIDPNNRLLARGPRFRLEAELVRDQALAASGLLSRKMEGPSVKPPRPKLGLTAAFGGSTDWESSQGEDRYRRGIYTYWQRSIPYPSMDTFDAPNREVCTVRRTRTNTPLQALVTLNDPVYVEAAQSLAHRVLKEGPSRVSNVAEKSDRQLILAFRLCVTRHPTDAELSAMRESLARIRERYAHDVEDARAMAGSKLPDSAKSEDLIELAAWTVLANVLLNLDETLTRP